MCPGSLFPPRGDLLDHINLTLGGWWRSICSVRSLPPVLIYGFFSHKRPFLALDLEVLSYLSSRVWSKFGGGNHEDGSAVRLPMEKGRVRIKVIRCILCAWDSAGPIYTSSYSNVPTSLRVGANIVLPLVTSQPSQSHVVCVESGFKPKFT